MNTENKGQPLIIQDGRELNSLLAKLVTKGALTALMMFVISLIQVFMDGATGRNLTLLIGSALSGMALFFYVSFVGVTGGNKERRTGFLPWFFVLVGFIPYLFGVYLFLYEGLWRLTRLLNGFSVRIILAGLFYTLGGYIIVGAIYKASEFGRVVSEGRIKIM
jgi:hypothetical protein